MPVNVRLCFGQPCSPCESGRFRRPSPRSAYTYTPSGASPAVIVSLSKVSPGFGPKQSRALHFWSSSARCSGSRPPSRSLRRRSRRLRGDTRRNASSADTPPRLATCLTAHPTNRVAACRSVRHSPPRPLPHLPQGAFFFKASALADVSSAHLLCPRHIHRPGIGLSPDSPLSTLSVTNRPYSALIAAGRNSAADLPRGSGGGVSAQCDATTKKTEATRFRRVVILPRGLTALAKCERPRNRCRHRLFRRSFAAYPRQS